MLRKLIEWALNNPLVVVLLAMALAVIGVYSFLNVNVEAYPDPAPAIVEVFAQMPGASAEEIERQVTVPLEVTFAGMPGLKSIHSKSLYGLSDLKMNWNYGNQWTYEAGRQEVINRICHHLAAAACRRHAADLPRIAHGRDLPLRAEESQGRAGQEIYTLNDMKALQDWVMEREFRTVPADRRRLQLRRHRPPLRGAARSRPPAALRRHADPVAERDSTTATRQSAAITSTRVEVAMTVRSVGLFGGGADPVTKVLGLKSPVTAAVVLRAEEQRRIRDLRSLVIASVNNQPVRVEDVVEGGRVIGGRIGRTGSRGQPPDTVGTDRLLEAGSRAAGRFQRDDCQSEIRTR